MGARSRTARTATPFLGSKDFDGKWFPPASKVTNGGEASFTGVLSATNVKRTEVVKLLKALVGSGYELAKRKTKKHTSVHPVVACIGDQGDGALISWGKVNPTGIHYSEMILAIPFVQKKGSKSWYTAIVRMYLDNQGAVGGGLAYGYRKQYANISCIGDKLAIWITAGGPRLRGKAVWGPTWHKGPAALKDVKNFPNFADLHGMMTTRLLGEGGICSQFDWDMAGAMVATATTSYTIQRPFLKGMSAWPKMSPYDSPKDGAVVMRGLIWRLGAVIKC